MLNMPGSFCSRNTKTKFYISYGKFKKYLDFEFRFMAKNANKIFSELKKKINSEILERMKIKFS